MALYKYAYDYDMMIMIIHLYAKCNNPSFSHSRDITGTPKI